MLPLEKKTLAFIKKHDLIKKGDRIVVAVSGGPDSLALVHFLFQQKENFDIELMIAHVDHMLRGEESRQDRLFVENFCKERNLPFISTEINVALKAEKERLGIEEAARKYRYQFFLEVMEGWKGNKLAVGHHGDDQIETIIMRLTRGSTGIARAGIQVTRSFMNVGEIIRPFLAVSKEEIEEYCHHYQLEPRIDASNVENEYTRNRFRHIILPFLKRENPKVIDQFQRFSEELSEDEQYLQQLARNHFQEVCEISGKEEITLHIPRFLQIPLPLQRRVIHLILNYLYQNKIQHITSTHVELIKDLFIHPNPSSRLHLPFGLTVFRAYDECHFTFLAKDKVSSYYYELKPGDRIHLPNGTVIGIEKGNHYQFHHSNVFSVDENKIQFPIIVRTRKPGDKIRVKGLNGSKKVKSIFIDEKIPLHERSLWPIVTDKTGKILWIPGLKKSEDEYFPQEGENYYYIYYINETDSGGLK